MICIIYIHIRLATIKRKRSLVLYYIRGWTLRSLRLRLVKRRPYSDPLQFGTLYSGWPFRACIQRDQTPIRALIRTDYSDPPYSEPLFGGTRPLFRPLFGATIQYPYSGPLFGVAIWNPYSEGTKPIDLILLTPPNLRGTIDSIQWGQ